VIGDPEGIHGEESSYNSILNSKRISSPGDPRAPNQLLGLVRFYLNPYGLRGIERVSIPTKGPFV
jgi:hypothetical protein